MAANVKPLNLLLEFEGYQVTGEKPLGTYEPSNGTFAGLREQLGSYKKRFPNGGAIGYVTYEAAREWEPRAFSDDYRPPIPAFRLVFFEQLHLVPRPGQNIVWRRMPLAVKEVPDFPAVRNFYCSGVEKIKSYIAAGDIYQANLTYQFECETRFRPQTIYKRLDDILPFGPAPRSAFLQWDDFAIVSNSPETFLTLRGGVLESKPIKGTIRRGAADDEFLKYQLQNDPKNRAENVMIVDLLRNDLGRVCEFGSVHVPALCEIQTLPTLHHLVSTVRGTLRPECDAIDAFQAAFPCGSITGAPKIRAMQILSELEPKARGISMGAIGYFAFNGDMDWSVAIRTATMVEHKATFHVGGGIVADSQPDDEYDEMRLKARALWSALHG